MTLPAGWLTDAEAEELIRLSDNKVVLELGAWKGRSTIVFSRSARYVISVDRHEGIPEVGGDDSLPDYLNSVRGTPNVAIVIAEFQDVIPFLGNIDLVYIDGNHDYQSVTRDTVSALSINPKMISYHDWDFDEVRKAATKTLARYPDYLVGSVASFQF